LRPFGDIRCFELGAPRQPAVSVRSLPRRRPCSSGHTQVGGTLSGGAAGPPKDEEAASEAAAGQCELETAQARAGRISWARLLKRVFDIGMQHCPNCGAGELKIVAAILERPMIQKIRDHLGLDHQPPPKGRAHEPREPGSHLAA
jgi:hypothetical protein